MKPIIVNILNNEYKVIVCFGSPNYIKKVLKQWHHDVSDDLLDMSSRRGICYYKKDCHPVICMPNFPRTNEEIGTLAHEAVHAVLDIFNKIEEPAGGEVFAHSVGAVVREVLFHQRKRHF